MDMLSVRGLCKRYPGFELRDVSFSLEPGYIMGFIGRNGAGKTTTLKSMLGLVHPDSGEVDMFGQNFREHELECKRRTGVVFGEFDCYVMKRLRTIIDVTRRFYSNWDEGVCERYLQRFELDPAKRVSELSAGMRVKFALALALSHNASLLVLDEPTSGLDPVSRDDLLRIFRELIEDGEHSILFSTHITSDLDKCSDYITYIKDGRIVSSTDRLSFTESHRLVSGKTAQLTPELRARLIGFREHAFGFIGLVDAADVDPASGLEYAPADVESIMLYREMEGKE